MMSEIDDLRRQLADTRQAWQDCREDVTTLRQELDEARAALRDCQRHLRKNLSLAEIVAVEMRHAAALKAAREAK